MEQNSCGPSGPLPWIHLVHINGEEERRVAVAGRATEIWTGEPPTRREGSVLGTPTRREGLVLGTPIRREGPVLGKPTRTEGPVLAWHTNQERRTCP